MSKRRIQQAMGLYAVLLGMIALMACATVNVPKDTRFNSIRWRTASERDNFGYDVYRGTTEAGPFERVNDTPVLGGGDSSVERSYEYVDRSIEAGVTYYYYVESISLDGRRRRLTPVSASKPKR